MSLYKKLITAVPVFLPTDLSGLAIWADGADISTLFQDSLKTIPVASDGDPVGAGVDLSGNGNDILQAVTAAKPTYKANIQNGLSVLRFDGGDELVTAGAISAGTDETIFVVSVNSADPLAGAVCGLNNGDKLLYSSAPQRLTYRYNTVNHDANGIVQTNWHQITGSHTAGISRFFIDGVEILPTVAVADSSRALRFRVGSRGAGEFLTGDVGEVIVYNRALSDSERSLVVAYLLAKWG